MSRRRSLAEDLMTVVSRMPWWVGVVLAIGFYVLLHAVASRPVAISPRATSVVGALVEGLATAGQYVLPILFLAAAALSAWRVRRSDALLGQAREREPQSAIDGVSWVEFEALIGAAFREMGYRVVETGGGGVDGGVDLVLKKGAEKFLVQCKQWRAAKVGVTVVRELYGVMAARGATGGFVVTSGTFTDDARAFAEGRNMTLLDGKALAKHLGSPGGRREAASPAAPEQAQAVIQRATATPRAAAPGAPACPSCGAPMVRRVAKRGANTGDAFWGCGTYPRCRGTRAAE